ncbi:hypothetical protein DL240_09220 [Lujinxingia litoralis]|uniref:Uncharacterized protein n=1 Tax=Lujinxingia litoralis TaxID=2211119 RepID=A0A328C710_9DELT|nr:hypothetical protein [Lujinxingia litoralis]RAL23056.1 hypothetical protein DL240_09220 [Lujinxingia litoralis]
MTSHTFPDDLLEATRTWVVAATGLAPERVIFDGATAPWPEAPFFMVRLPQLDRSAGTDELHYELDANQAMQARVVGQRSATGVLRVCGPGGAALLSQCSLALSLPALQRELQALAITLSSTGPTTPVNDETLAELPAPVFEREFALHYALKLSSTDVEPHFERLVIDVELDADPHFTDPLMVTLEAD